MILNNCGIETIRPPINFGFRLKLLEAITKKKLLEASDSKLCFQHFHKRLNFYQASVQFSSVAQLCPTLYQAWGPKYCPDAGLLGKCEDNLGFLYLIPYFQGYCVFIYISSS